MPVKLIGMLSVTPPQDTAFSVIGGSISPEWIAQTAREHEAADYDQVLVGYYSTSADGFAVTQHAGGHTERLSFLLAHRPGIVLPAMAARKIASLDQIVKGRLAMHIIIGGGDAEMEKEGDYSTKEARYERGAEYLAIVRRLWTEQIPIDFEGRHYRVHQAFSEVKPYQKPYPILSFGGASPGATAMGAEHCDTFAIWGEPLKETRARITAYRKQCATHGRRAEFSISFRPIIAATEGEAWDKAYATLDAIQNGPTLINKDFMSAGGQRILDVADRGDIHDTCLWTPIAKATSGVANATCLVGTPDQVTDALMKYYDMGIRSFLLRGFNPKSDVTELGRELFPRIRARVAEIDRIAA